MYTKLSSHWEKPSLQRIMVFSSQRLLLLCIPTLLLLSLIFHAFRTSTPVSEYIRHPKQVFAGDQKHTKTPPRLTADLQHLFSSITQPVAAENFTDSLGKVYELPGHPIWEKPLRKDVLIVDIDTRRPTGRNQIFNDTIMDWETLQMSGAELVSESVVNHYLYSQIHGYDYMFYSAKHIEGHYDTWTRPHIINNLLQSGYKFVIALDADAAFNHLSVPMEWLFNRWNITTNTTIALPQDVIEGDNCKSCDSKGKIVLNCGFIIAQNLPYTFDMLDAWMKCTTEERYKGCGHWKENWSHEQRAFSEYIRYDFNEADNIRTLPCAEAMGYPGMHAVGPDEIRSKCTGQFVRHYTLDKPAAKSATTNAVMQSMTELLQKALLEKKEDIWVKEGGDEPEEKPQEFSILD